MRTRGNVLLVVLILAPWQDGAAQTSARDSVLSTMERAFDAMRARDTTGLRTAFDSTARLIGVPDSAARPTRPRTVSQFLADIAHAPPDRAFDERMYDPEVRVDGPIAQLWTY